MATVLLPVPRAPSLADVLLLATLVGITSWLSLTLTRVPSGVASVWVANGLMVGWLLSRPTQLWPAFLAACFLAGVLARGLAGDAFGLALGLNVANLIEVLLIAGIVRGQVPDIRDPKRWLDLGRIATLSTLMACAVSALIASSVMLITSGAPLTNFLVWYAAHVIGMVLVATLTLVAHRERAALLGRAGRRLEFVASLLLIGIVVAAIFSQTSYPLLFLAYPLLLWATFRHRFAGLLGGVFVLVVIGSIATALGLGPLALVEGISDTERTFLLQAFIAAACLLTFPVALVMADLARLSSEVRESETRYRMLADYSHDVIIRMSPQGERLYVSPSVTDTLGWEPGEVIARWDLVHPEDRAKHATDMAALLADGRPRVDTYRMLHKDGHYLWLEAVARLIPSADGNGAMDVVYAGRDISKRMAAEEALQVSRLELEQLARVDSLTGLANRRQFEERLALGLARSQRQDIPITVLFLDIDHFKQINDRFGHAAGDAVLKDFAEHLAACVRTGDLAARLAGDEFVVLVEDAATADAAETIARKLIDAMARPTEFEGDSIAVTSSIGIAFCTRATDQAELLALADKALYAAKAAGRNTWRLLTMQDA